MPDYFERPKPRSAHLEDARKQFRDFESATVVARTPVVEKLRRTVKMKRAKFCIASLAKAEADFAALDPTGKRDGAEMGALLRNFIRDYYIDEAREDYARLKDGMGIKRSNGVAFNIDPSHFEHGIRKNLLEAGVDYSALDPEGRIGHHEMLRNELPKQVRNAHLRIARSEFRELLEGISVLDAAIGKSLGKEKTPEALANSIHSHLKKAHVGYAALDVEGTHSEKQMRDIVGKAVKAHHYKVGNVDDLSQQLKALSTMPKGNGRSR